MDQVFWIVGNVIYLVLLGIALWGAFCCVVVWRRVAEKRFISETAQFEFLEQLDRPLSKGDMKGAAALCDEDARAVPQLALLAFANHQIGFAKIRQLVEDRFQRDILADLEHRMTWVHTVIKSAPMVGLFGTVVGMMGAFGKLASGGDSVQAPQLAEDIMLALITTASGLAIAIPLIIAVAAVNIRIRKMEELTLAGLNRLLESVHKALLLGRKR